MIWTSHPCLHTAFDFQNEIQAIPIVYIALQYFLEELHEKKRRIKGRRKKKAATTSTETHSDKDFRYLFSLRFLFMFNFSNFACVLMFRFRQTPTFISIIPFLRGVQKGTSTVWVHMEWIGWMVISLKNSFPFLLHFNNYQSSFRVSFSVSVAGHTFITPTKCNGFFFFLM